MGDQSNPKKLTGTATTTLTTVLLYNIAINKTLTGTLTVNEAGVAVGLFAIGTTPGNYHQVPAGARYSALTLVLSAGDDVTVFTRGY